MTEMTPNPRFDRNVGRQGEASAQNGARGLGLQLLVFDARTLSEIEQAFDAMSVDWPDGILIAADFLFMEHEVRIAKRVQAIAVPAISPDKEFRSVLSYGPDVRESVRRTAAYVDRILRGARPADLPVQEMSNYRLVVNLPVAREIGLTVPHELLVRADEIIQ